jgi:hypothetical protein
MLRERSVYGLAAEVSISGRCWKMMGLASMIEIGLTCPFTVGRALPLNGVEHMIYWCKMEVTDDA